MREKTEELLYEYHNIPIPGGGYATGFVFQPKVDGMIYLRTDIGGSYRFDKDLQRWTSLCDHVTMEDRAETYPIAIAVDERHPERLYIASGIWNEPEGKFSVSEDYGENFRHYRMPMPIHGNLPGRGTGYRLIVDKRDESPHVPGLVVCSTIRKSKGDSIYRSLNYGETWEEILHDLDVGVVTIRTSYMKYQQRQLHRIADPARCRKVRGDVSGTLVPCEVLNLSPVYLQLSLFFKALQSGAFLPLWRRRKHSFLLQCFNISCRS